MELAGWTRKAVRRVLLGPHDLPQQFVVGMREPQQEVAVELHGLGAPRDVTDHHSLACIAPFTIGIGFEDRLESGMQLSLHFRERGSPQRLLGELEMRLSTVLTVDGCDICCFEARSRRNYCLPKPRLWARYSYWAYQRWRRPPAIRMTARDVHAAATSFICPRPVVLVSVGDGGIGNLFPMDLMGPLGNRLFGFALNSERMSALQVKRAGRLALSTVPFEQASLAAGLGGNHNREGLHWEALPLQMTASSKLGLPVPCFSLRVREMEVAAFRNLGSHTLFVARVLHDEHWRDGSQFFIMHGMYEEWRQERRERNQGVA